MTNEHVTPITETSGRWIGSIAPESTGAWIDSGLLLMFGGYLAGKWIDF